MSTAMPDLDQFSFASGSKEIEATTKRTGGAFSRFEPTILKWNEDDPRHIVRFLDDDKRDPEDPRRNTWKGIDVHGYPETVAQPDSYTGDKWPEGMPAVCRYDGAWGGYWGSCIPCDEKLPRAQEKQKKFAAPQRRMFARVVVREKVVWTQEDSDAGLIPKGKRVGGVRGYRDKMIDAAELDAEGEPTGKQIKIPDIRIVEQSRKLFFQHLIGIAQQNLEDDDDNDPASYTILDRDFTITRSGKGSGDTAYAINPVRNSEFLEGETGQTVEFDGELLDLEGVTWDVRDERVLAYYEQFLYWSLAGYFFERASDEWHEKWFLDGGWEKWVTSKDDEAEDDEPPKKKATAAKAAKAAKPEKAAKKPAPPVDEDEGEEETEDDDEEETEDDDEEEAPPVKPAKAAKAAQPAKPAKKPAPPADEDDDEDDDGPPAGRLASLRNQMTSTNGKGPERTDSSMEDEDDEEFEPVGT